MVPGQVRLASREMKSADCESVGHVREGVDPMGRGRAKAKQTKVARDLKYRTHETDFGALAQELHGEDSSSEVSGTESDEYDDWADYSPSSSRD